MFKGNMRGLDSHDEAPDTKMRGLESLDECGVFKMPCSVNFRDQHDCPGDESGSLVRHPQLDNVSVRMQTFSLWPPALLPRPQALADAGFFYTGQGDRCICFSCGGGLKDWKPTDDPWLEHKSHFPKCLFVVKETAMGRIPKQKLTTVVLEPTNGPVSDALLCKVCYLKQMCMTFLPCKHVSSCETCASCLMQCPICREKIESSFRVYLQ